MSKHSESTNDQHPRQDGDDVQLWGREISREDFVEGHYGDSRKQPTPEGGQAGIAQGNVKRRTRTQSRPRTAR